MKVALYHPLSRNNPSTQFAADAAKGVSSVTVKNTAGFDTSKFVILGSVGYPQSEIVRPNTITVPDTFALASATNFPHNADNKIVLIDFDSFHVYLSTTGIAGSYTLLATVNITIDQDYTLFEDDNAQPTYYYKYAPYNSFSQLEGDLSDAISATGFTFYSLKTLIDRTLSLFGDMNGDFVSRNEVRDYLNEWYELAQKKHAIATKRLNIKTFEFTVQQGIKEYANVIPADFLMEKAVKVSNDAGRNFNGNATMIGVDSLGTIYQTNVMYGYGIYGGTFILDRNPSNSTDIIKVYYVPVPQTLQFQTDLLIQPFQNSSNIFVRGALSMCFAKDKKLDDYEVFDKKASDLLEDFISFVKKMQSLHPQFVEIMDGSRV